MWLSREPASFGTPELFTEVPTMQTLSRQEGDTESNRNSKAFKNVNMAFVISFLGKHRQHYGEQVSGGAVRGTLKLCRSAQ